MGTYFSMSARLGRSHLGDLSLRFFGILFHHHIKFWAYREVFIFDHPREFFNPLTRHEDPTRGSVIQGRMFPCPVPLECFYSDSKSDLRLSSSGEEVSISRTL